MEYVNSIVSQLNFESKIKVKETFNNSQKRCLSVIWKYDNEIIVSFVKVWLYEISNTVDNQYNGIKIVSDNLWFDMWILCSWYKELERLLFDNHKEIKQNLPLTENDILHKFISDAYIMAYCKKISKNDI